jgi:hypothetical protein
MRGNPIWGTVQISVEQGTGTFAHYELQIPNRLGEFVTVILRKTGSWLRRLKIHPILGRSCGYMQLQARLPLQVTEHAEEVPGLRIAARPEHADKTFRRVSVASPSFSKPIVALM